MLKAKRKLLLATLVLLTGIKGFCSDSTNAIYKRNIFFVTFGGKENFGSINYEHIFSIRKKITWSYSAGVEPWTASKKFSLPVSVNMFTTGSLHHIELDLTATFYMDKIHPYDGGWKEDFNKQLYLSPFVCYRLQKNKGLVFKTGAGPQILLDPPSNNITDVRAKILHPSVFASVGISM